MRPHSLAIASLSLAVLAAVPARAQGTVGAQGLGYPPGQVSTLARGSAGSLADFDAGSAVNPASVLSVPGTTLFVHFAPEHRRTTTAGSSDDSRVVRFPMIGAVLPFAGRAAIGISSSTLLDRSWATLTDVDGVNDGAGLLEGFEVRGALNDVRLAGAWGFSRNFAAGVGLHAITGSNQLTVSRVDQTEGGDAGFQTTTEIGFEGSAASAGVQWNVAPHLGLALAGQVGGTVRAKLGDSAIAEGTAPGGADVDVRYSGITGAVIGVRAAWRGWSSLEGLGGATLDARDAWDYAVGADIAGPRLFGAAASLRAGFHMRDLPFAVLGDQPSEQAVTAGLGLTLGGGRVLLDVSGERARRRVADARETAWTFGAGVTVRP